MVCVHSLEQRMKPDESMEVARRGAGSSRPEPDGAPLSLGILPDLVGRQLRIAQLLAFKDFSMEVDGTSLTPGSFETLELLDKNPGLGQTRLATAIGLDKSSLVPAITRLEALGLVERRPSSSDRRANELRITAKGRRTLGVLRTYVLEREARITAGMSKSEIDTLNKLLKRVAHINL
jgi:DNA-binding MarR family transcriptional regulator